MVVVRNYNAVLVCAIVLSLAAQGIGVVAASSDYVVVSSRDASDQV